MSDLKGKMSVESLQLQLDEAVQMLRLVAVGKRTILEVQEWLDMNYSNNTHEIDILTSLIVHEKDRA